MFLYFELVAHVSMYITSWTIGNTKNYALHHWFIFKFVCHRWDLVWTSMAILLRVAYFRNVTMWLNDRCGLHRYALIWIIVACSLVTTCFKMYRVFHKKCDGLYFASPGFRLALWVHQVVVRCCWLLCYLTSTHGLSRVVIDYFTLVRVGVINVCPICFDETMKQCLYYSSKT